MIRLQERGLERDPRSCMKGKCLSVLVLIVLPLFNVPEGKFFLIKGGKNTVFFKNQSLFNIVYFDKDIFE